MGARKFPKPDCRYEVLANWLRSKGFTVEVSRISGSRKVYRVWRVTGNNIMGAFCEQSPDSHPQLSGRFAADHAGCFESWTKAPLVMDITDDMDFGSLERYLTFLGSDAGYRYSSSYAYLDESVLPRVA